MSFEAIDIENISGSQVIKLPKGIKIDDDKVYLKQVGNAIYILPYHAPWQSLISSLDEFSEDFMTDREQPDQQTREFLD